MGLFVAKPLPFDPNSEPLPTLGLRVKRRIPSSEIFSEEDDSIITMKVGESIEREIVLHEPEYSGIEKGKKYAVGVQGTWHGVWIREQVEVRRATLLGG
jgi:hypothetical protein